MWRHICAYLERWIRPTPRCSSWAPAGADANNVQARRVVAMDIDSTVERIKRGVTAVVGDCADLSGFADGNFDVVFAST